MIYVVIPGDCTTGGIETLHQLADLLYKAGEEVGVKYVYQFRTSVPKPYQKYHIDIVKRVDDKEENVIILPETLTHLTYRFRRAKICIWWLSLDNFFGNDPKSLVSYKMKQHNMPWYMTPLAYAALFFKGKIHTQFYNFDENGRFFHAYNCDYALNYLLARGVSKERTLYLCGPLNQTFFDRADAVVGRKRENIILYNPKKGKAFTDKLIEEAKKRGITAQFIPIKNMTADEISDLMSRAKLYIDFGNFPGPERIPREAVIMGCNIITSKNGAAGDNEVDIPIPMELKFEDNDENIPVIIEKMQEVLENYEIYFPWFDAYRKKVRRQLELLPENAKLLLERI